MLTASLIGTALGITIVLGGGITTYLWLARRRKLFVRNGIASLAAMRWREFSHFVVDALRGRGFDHDPTAPRPQKGQLTDVLLSRNDQAWLLGCKQSPGELITATQISDLARGVRETGAGGGILATLGKIDPDARRDRGGIELLDGPAVWALVEPLLPKSLRLDIEQRARTRTIRDTQLSCLGALVVGFALAMLMPSAQIPDTPVEATGTALAAGAAVTLPAGTDAAAAVAGPTSTALPAATVENEEQRREGAMRDISLLPVVEKAMWATRSTLVVYLAGSEANAQDVTTLCATLERYEELRASRLQLQPAADSGTAVRFMQCHAY